ncbi:MAG: hypothetical protein WCL50_09795 [Spirochaetota bacterium]
MISVEQIKALEDRIERALAFIANLKADNATLRSKVSELEAVSLLAGKRAEEAEYRVLELEDAAAIFHKDQLRIEEGIVHALEKLDAFEDLVLRGEATDAPAISVKPKASPVQAFATTSPAPQGRAEKAQTAELVSRPIEAPVPVREVPAQILPAQVEMPEAEPLAEEMEESASATATPQEIRGTVAELDIF